MPLDRIITRTYALTTYLTAIVLFAVLPVLLFSGLVVYRLVQNEREMSERYLLKSAQELALAFDQEISATIRSLEALGSSQSVPAGEYKRFHAIMVTALPKQETWANILLHNRDMQRITVANQPFTNVLGGVSEPESFREVIETGRPVVGNVTEIPKSDTVAAKYGFVVRVPIKDEAGKVTHVLTAGITTDALQKLFSQYSHAPNEWVRALIDKKGTLAVRNRDSQKYVGGLASKTLRDILFKTESGIKETQTLEGIPAYTAIHHAPLSGWYVALAVPADTFEAPYRRTTRTLLSLGILLLAVSLFLAWFIGRWMRKSFRSAADDAAVLAKGQTPAVVHSRISEVEDLRTSLNQAAVLLRSRDKAKSDFIANMSHELRTPLGIILGMIDLLSRNALPVSDQSRSWEIIKRNGDQLARLIDDILDFAKLDANRLTIENVDFQLKELIQSVADAFAQTLVEKNVELKTVFDEGSPDYVCADPIRIRQIIFNLVGNSVKFTHQGSIELRLHRLEGDAVRITVSDTGIGMSAEQQSQLFSEFTQGDSSHTRKYGGTGLGLSLSRKLARLLNGNVELVRSAPNEGAVFKFVFKAASPSVSQLSATSTAELPQVTFPNVQILLAEDSPDNVLLIQGYLKKTGAEITVAKNGREAVELMKSKVFDLILMDIQMPEMDGYEATKKIRENNPAIPIIALTAHALADNRSKALSMGFTHYLTKPVMRGILFETIKRYL